MGIPENIPRLPKFIHIYLNVSICNHCSELLSHRRRTAGSILFHQQLYSPPGKTKHCQWREPQAACLGDSGILLSLYPSSLYSIEDLRTCPVNDCMEDVPSPRLSDTLCKQLLESWCQPAEYTTAHERWFSPMCGFSQQDHWLGLQKSRNKSRLKNI